MYVSWWVSFYDSENENVLFDTGEKVVLHSTYLTIGGWKETWENKSSWPVQMSGMVSTFLFYICVKNIFVIS